MFGHGSGFEEEFDSNSEEFESGSIAGLIGAPKEGCPYKKGKKRKLWLEGWQSGCDDAEDNPKEAAAWKETHEWKNGKLVKRG